MPYSLSERIGLCLRLRPNKAEIYPPLEDPACGAAGSVIILMRDTSDDIVEIGVDDRFRLVQRVGRVEA